jgi:hypothetical protein
MSPFDHTGQYVIGTERKYKACENGKQNDNGDAG